MTREQAKELLPLIQAYADGAEVQYNHGTESNPQWTDIKLPVFTDYPSDYRIKPKPREFWLVQNTGGSWCGSFYAVEQLNANGEPFPNQIRVREILD